MERSSGAGPGDKERGRPKYLGSQQKHSYRNREGSGNRYQGNILSYNTRNFGCEKQEFLKYLLDLVCCDKITILCNQENILLYSNTYKIQQVLPSYQTSDHYKGRAKNGMFIAVPNSVKR